MTSLLRKPFRYTFFNASFFIIGANLIVHMLTMLGIPVANYMALNPVLLFRDHAFWQPLTYMFVHGNFSHLLLNMLGLFFFAPQVEQRMGSFEFLLFYFLTGILAGILSAAIYWFTGMYYVFLVGASGAIFAVLLAFATYYPNQLVFIFGLIPLRAVTMVLLFTGIELASSIFSLRSGVAHSTHLLGFAIAFLYFLIRLGTNPITVFRDSRNSRWS